MIKDIITYKPSLLWKHGEPCLLSGINLLESPPRLTVAPMLCIFCLNKRPLSLEHVLPLAVGGTITTDRVCEPCNSMLGSRVDAALSNYLPIRTRWAQLGLKGNAGEAPYLFEMLLGEATLIGLAANWVQTTLDKKTGKLDIRQLYHASTIVKPDGTKMCQITLVAWISSRFRKSSSAIENVMDFHLFLRRARCGCTGLRGRSACAATAADPASQG